MNIPLSLEQVLFYTAFGSLVIFGTRVFPFALFSRKEPPRVLRFIEKYIPSMVMGVLLVYCLRSVPFNSTPYGIPEIVSLLFVFAVHWKFANALASIAGGTILFMILQRIL